MIGNELAAMSIADLRSLLRRREISSRDVIDALRERIEAVDGDDTAPHGDNSLGSALRVRHLNARRDDIAQLCLKTAQDE